MALLLHRTEILVVLVANVTYGELFVVSREIVQNVAVNTNPMQNQVQCDQNKVILDIFVCKRVAMLLMKASRGMISKHCEL